MFIKGYKKNIDGVFIQDFSEVNTAFEKYYHSLRMSENRIYSDDELAQLPSTPSSHQYHHEWEIREKSAGRFLEYLKQKNKPLKILDIGCGNGWLSNKLASINNCEVIVIAIDLNYEELKQASRVFNDKNNLTFFYGNIDSIIQIDMKFDIILFSASIQYFSSIKDVITKSFSLLNDDGEIHIIDSPLYKLSNIDKAKERSKKYFKSIGFEVMNNFYFHHSPNELEIFNFKILYNPNSFKKYFYKNRNPFHWVCIFKDK